MLALREGEGVHLRFFNSSMEGFCGLVGSTLYCIVHIAAAIEVTLFPLLVLKRGRGGCWSLV